MWMYDLLILPRCCEMPVKTTFFFNDTPTTELYTLSLHDALPISSLTSFPSVKSTRFWASPDEVVVRAVSPPDWNVFMVRLTAHVGVKFVVGGLLPLRTTSATEPFSTNGPSGASDHLLKAVVVQSPAGRGLRGTADQ